eukprot:SAG22_NODE_3_length_48349_cov_158.681180_4_plen_59_part_00
MANELAAARHTTHATAYLSSMAGHGGRGPDRARTDIAKILSELQLIEQQQNDIFKKKY